MEIESIGFSSVQDCSEYYVSEEKNESYSHTAESTSDTSAAGWKRMMTETNTVAFQEREEELLDRIEQAWNAHRYVEVLNLLDKVDPDQVPLDIPGVFNVYKSLIKSMCLEMLGRSEEALQSINQALDDSKTLIEKLKITLFEEMKKNFPELAPELIAMLLPQIETALADEFESIDSHLIMQRGFIHLSLDQKEEAISDFRTACDKENGFDSIFFLKILETKLGAQILPTQMDDSLSSESLILQGKYNEALNLLSKGKDTSSYYQSCLCYAMLGQYDQAFECYEKMGLDDPDYQEDYPPIPALLYSLKGDWEMAQIEMDRWPEQEPMYLFYMKSFAN